MIDSSAAVFDGASRLWQMIVREAGLDLDGFDRDLVNELSGNLGVASEDFAGELDRAAISVERLIEQLLHLIVPYAAILREILTFFARVGAQSSAKNLRVRFEFDRLGDSFEFDLRNFRDWTIEFDHAVFRVKDDEIDDFRALEIRSVFVAQDITYELVGSRWSERMPRDADIAQWFIESPTDPGRLGALPPPPTVVNAELGALLARVWRFLGTAASGAIGRPISQALSPDDIRTIVRGAYLLSEEEDLLLARLREVFIDVPTREVEMDTLIERLVEVLNLPAWKRRSELYSVWIGIRLITALGEGVRVHVVDRSIVFSFSGTHLATIGVSSDENLHVWCELRTWASGLLGKGRKRAIQPDYVILREPTSHPGSAVLVVEAKQYARQSGQRFADALIDYAHGHPRAQVALVNYGPTTPSVLERVREVDASLLARTQVIGNLRPGSPTSIREFEELVRSAIPRVGSPESILENEGPNRGRPADGCASSGVLHLSWEADVDLDLHCWITDTQGERQHIHFIRLVGDLGGSRVELNRDVRTGGDAETLVWENTDSVSLDFAVHAYSPGSDIALAHPRVESKICDRVWMIEPPAGQRGSWWRLFSIGGRASAIRIWNSIGADSPFADDP